jgi:signal transduction histidine kinase
VTLALGGWFAASVALSAALLAWRLLALRTEAVARACHELRGPLTAARLGLQLGDRLGVLPPDRMRAIDQELGRAALALDDLGGSGSWPLSAGRPEPDARWGGETVDARELLTASVEAWRAAAGTRGAELRMRWSGCCAVVHGDRFRLAQATGNLIANAIEHGGGVIEVHGRGTPAGARIEVTDGGPGLRAPVSELARPRARVRGRDAAARGRGLRIALAVAQSHGGRLASAPSERGARLVLELPAAGVAGAAGPAPRSPVAPGLPMDEGPGGSGADGA